MIAIDDWDFRWQGAYVYRQAGVPARRARASTRTSAFDNSDENPFNPSDPPIRVREGWRTTDEMCLFYFTVVPHDPVDTNDVYRAMFASFRRSGAPD